MKLMKYEEWIKSVHQADGVSQELENGIRRDAVTFMIVFGKNMELKTPAIAKAIFIFHRYSKIQSFNRFDYLLYAVASIFITSKFEDKPLRLDAIVRMYLPMNLIYQRKRVVFPIGSKELDPSEFLIAGTKKDIKYDQTTIQFFKDSFKSIEKNILSEIGYDLDIDLPYSYLNMLEEKNLMLDEAFLDVVKSIINKSWRTTLCLYFEPKVIALGALNLAQSMSGFAMKNSKLGESWISIFGETSLEEVAEVTKYLKELP